jgi:hypothetical protein
MTQPPAREPSEPRSHTLRGLWLALALHVALFLGVYQCGLTSEELQRLQIAGPSHLLDAYIKAAHLFGPFGVVRAYFRGESDERLYFEYAQLLLHGRTDLAYIAERQNDRALANNTLPARAWPYRDVRVEYPPLAFLAVVPPALIASDYLGYRRGFAAYMLLLHWLNLWLAWRLLRPDASLCGDARVVTRAAWMSLGFCAALGALVSTRMDHLVTTWILLVLLACAQSDHAQLSRVRLRWALLAGLLAAAGVMTKLVPGLAALAALVLWFRSDAHDLSHL